MEYFRNNNGEAGAQTRARARAEAMWSNAAQIRLPASRATMARIRRNRGLHEQPGTTYTIHDMTSPAYSWLLPGWVVEERQMSHHRLYRYYYDPAGRQYRTKALVRAAWAVAGLIVID